MAGQTEEKLSLKYRNRLHEMFHVVGDQMTEKDVRLLKYIYSGITSPKLLSLVKTGYDFFMCLEKLGRVSETNFKNILDLLRIITRHDLSQFVTLHKRSPVCPDIVNEYLEKTFKDNSLESTPPGYIIGVEPTPSTNEKSQSENNGETLSIGKKRKIENTDHRRKKKSRLEFELERATSKDTSNQPEPCCSNTETFIPSENWSSEKVTCDIKLRVRAEYSQHDSALEGNIVSDRPNLLDRQFEKFMRANTILKSRDLGSIVCNIKFSDLTYLDAFWKDYLNGSLLESLKGIFITDSLLQAVGNEAIKLLVNVDEDDYEAGRIKLLQNFK